MKTLLQVQKAMISITSIIVLMIVMTIVTTNIYFIYNSNISLNNLKEFQDNFKKEIEVISFLKCELLNRNKPTTFNDVSFTYEDEIIIASYDFIQMEIQYRDNIILDYITLNK